MIMARIYRRESVKLEENIEDIINFAEVKRISINLNLLFCPPKDNYM